MVSEDFILARSLDGKIVKKYEFYCPVCKKTSLFTKYQIQTRKYCSRGCSNKVNGRSNLGKWIGGEITSKRNKEPEFRKKVSEGLKEHFRKNPRYTEDWYIKRYGKNYKTKKAKHSHGWRKLSISLRQKYNCHRCEAQEKLDVHHIIPYSVSQDNSLNNLVVLCKGCHKKTEENTNAIYRIMGCWEVTRDLYRLRWEDCGKPIRYSLA